MLNKKWLILFVLFIFIEPAYFTSIKLIDNAFDITKLLICLLIVLLYLINKKVSKFILSIVGLQSVMMISTVLNGGDLWKCMVSSATNITICIFVEMSSKNGTKELIKILYYMLGLYIIINFFTVYIFPEGLYIIEEKNYICHFLGYRNNFILIILPYMCIGQIYKLQNKKKIGLDYIIISILGIISIFKVWSATGIIGITIFTFYLLIFNKFNFTKILNLTNYVIANAVIFFEVVVFRIQEKFSKFFENVLKKSVTFTGRTNIWDRAIEGFLKSPIFGNGIETEEVITVKFGGIEAIHAHNYYLDIAYKGGIIAISIFVVILILCIKNMKQYMENSIAKVLSFTIFVFLIMFQVEAYPTMPLFFILLTLTYHISKLIEG